MLAIILGVAHKRRPQSGRFFRCGRPQTLWIFRNLWCVRTDKEGRGWASADKGVAGVNFSRFWTDVLYERSLISIFITVIAVFREGGRDFW